MGASRLYNILLLWWNHTQLEYVYISYRETTNLIVKEFVPLLIRWLK